MPEFLVIRELSKTYFSQGQPIPILQGIDLTVGKGELVSITGVSGVGKSTFLQVLGTLDRPTSGAVLLDGESLFDKNDAALARFRNLSIGFVYQFHHLLSEFTALENVMLPRLISGASRSEAEERARFLLEEVGLSHRTTHRPGELSGGEQQRVAIARSLVMTPALVLADEPTGNLDRYTAEGIEDLLLELNRKYLITFILATHNEKLAGCFTRRLRLAHGIFETL